METSHLSLPPETASCQVHVQIDAYKLQLRSANGSEQNVTFVKNHSTLDTEDTITIAD